jgi:hypothetical protein
MFIVRVLISTSTIQSLYGAVKWNHRDPGGGGVTTLAAGIVLNLAGSGTTQVP